MKNSIYRTFLLIVLVLTIGFILIVIGNIITIGDKIGTLSHPYVEHAFYLTLLLLIIIFIVIPVARVMATPTLPELNEARINGEDDSIHYNRINRLANKLVRTCGYIKEAGAAKEYRNVLQQKIKEANSTGNREIATKQLENIIKEELDARFSIANEKTRTVAKHAFAATAISQNSTIDALSILFLNCKLVHQIIQTTGFRPNIRQTVNIYINVISSAFFSHLTQEGAEKSAALVISQFTKKLKAIPYGEIIVGSTIDGVVNALLTLRVGYLTVKYLKKGAKGQITDDNDSASAAIKMLPEIIGNKVKHLVDFITKFFKSDASL